MWAEQAVYLGTLAFGSGHGDVCVDGQRKAQQEKFLWSVGNLY